MPSSAAAPGGRRRRGGSECHAPTQARGVQGIASTSWPEAYSHHGSPANADGWAARRSATCIVQDARHRRRPLARPSLSARRSTARQGCHPAGLGTSAGAIAARSRRQRIATAAICQGSAHAEVDPLDQRREPQQDEEAPTARPVAVIPSRSASSSSDHPVEGARWPPVIRQGQQDAGLGQSVCRSRPRPSSPVKAPGRAGRCPACSGALRDISTPSTLAMFSPAWRMAEGNRATAFVDPRRRGWPAAASAGSHQVGGFSSHGLFADRRIGPVRPSREHLPRSLRHADAPW